MEVLHACCCGLDVHKKGVTACVLWAEGKGKKRKEKRQFGTMTRDLLALADWLRACGVTHVAMESTGVYWKPVWNVLEGQFEILLVNAQHIKAVPGRKTDQNDAEWIADLCPGSYESAGKRKSGKTRKGNAWLRRCLCQAAWAVSTKRNNYLSALYRRLAARRGTKRAILAVAHKLLQIAFYILRDGKCYRELGADYFDRLHPYRVKRHLVRRLESLGFQVNLVPASQAL